MDLTVDRHQRLSHDFVLPVTNLAPITNVSVAAGFSIVAVGEYELPSGTTLELAAGAWMEVL